MSRRIGRMPSQPRRSFESELDRAALRSLVPEYLLREILSLMMKKVGSVLAPELALLVMSPLPSRPFAGSSPGNFPRADVGRGRNLTSTTIVLYSSSIGLYFERSATRI